MTFILEFIKCVIDLKDNSLLFRSSEVKIYFLQESKIDKKSLSFSKENSEIKEESVKELVNLGFKENEVVKALKECSGNKVLAASLLFSRKK